MKLLIAATAALLTTSGTSSAIVMRSTAEPPLADGFCSVLNAAEICVNNLCVYWDVAGTNPLPVQDPFCVPTPLPDGCTLGVPPSDINGCLPTVEPEPA